jgi:hypothetical protein
MPHTPLERILRWLDGQLPSAEREDFARDLSRSEQLRSDTHALATLRTHLRDTLHRDAEAFADPHLADRVWRRLQAAPKSEYFDELAPWLGRYFRQVAFAGGLAVVLLAGYNTWLSRSFATEASTTEAVLGLPPVSAASVYDLDLMAASADVSP